VPQQLAVASDDVPLELAAALDVAPQQLASADVVPQQPAESSTWSAASAVNGVAAVTADAAAA
jgi:hypothetical protein